MIELNLEAKGKKLSLEKMKEHIALSLKKANVDPFWIDAILENARPELVELHYMDNVSPHHWVNHLIVWSKSDQGEDFWNSVFDQFHNGFTNPLVPNH